MSSRDKHLEVKEFLNASNLIGGTTTFIDVLDLVLDVKSNLQDSLKGTLSENLEFLRIFFLTYV